MKINRFLFRSLRLLFRGARWFAKPAVAAVCLTLILADLYCEISGLPAPAVEIIRARLGAHGVLADMGRVRAGLFQGITVEQLVVYNAGSACGPMFEAEELRMSLHRRQLLLGRVRPRTIEIDNLVVYWPFQPKAPAGSPVSSVAHLNGTFRIGQDTIEVSSLGGDVAGVRVQLRGRLEHMREAAARTPAAVAKSAQRRPAAFGWGSVFAAAGNTFRGPIEESLKAMVSKGVPQGDGRIDAQFTVPLDAPENSTVWGSVSLADADLRGVEVRSVRSHFTFRKQNLRLDQLLVRVIGDQMATAEIELDLPSRHISGRAEGILNPEVALHLLGYPVPRFLSEIKFGSPLAFTAVLRPSPWDLASIDGEVQFKTQDVWYREFEVGAAAGRVTFAPAGARSGSAVLSDVSYNNLYAREICGDAQLDGDILRITKLAATLDEDGRETLAGSVTLFPKTHELAFDARGALLPATLAQLLPAIPPQIVALCRETSFAGDPPQFACQLERSPYSPAQWSGTLNIAFGAGVCRDLPIGNGRTELRFAHGVLQLHQQLTFGEKNAEQLDVTAVANLPDQRVSGRASGRLYVDRTCRALRLAPTFLVERLAQYGAPTEFTAELEESPFAPAAWRLTGRISAEKTRYEDLAFEKGTGDVVLRPGSVLFRNVTTQTAAGDVLAGEFDVALPSGDIGLHATISGDPRLVRVFIAEGRSRDVFDRVWNGFVWDAESPPHTTIDALKYVDLGGPGNYRFQMRCHIEAANAVWKGFKTDLLKTDLELNLPRNVAIRNCEVRSGGCHAAGEVFLDYEDMSLCQFRLQAVSDPRLVLVMLDPTWPSLLGKARFPDQTQIDCKGSFYLGPDPRPRLQGVFQSATFQYGHHTLEDFFAKWQLDGRRLNWAPLTARAYGGKIMATGNYDFAMDSGQLLLTAEGVGLTSLLGGGKMLEGVSAKGKVSGNGTLELLKPRPEDALQLTGTGRLWVEDADLWGFPILSKLGELIGFVSLGRMSRLDADLTFAGDHVLVPEFHTDGTILALRGSGDYAWDPQKLNFKLRGEALKTTQVIPFLLKPLFWMFEAELTGSLNDPHWHMTHGISRIFSE